MSVYAVLNMLLLVAGAAAAIRWVLRFGQHRALCLTLMVTGVVAAIAAYLFVPADLLWRSMSPLREGGSLIATRLMSGVPVDRWPNQQALAQLSSAGYAVPLEGIIRANVSLALLNLFWFAAASTQLIKSWLAPIFVILALAGDAFFRIGAVSELPAQLGTSYFLVGAACFVCLDGRANKPLAWLAGATLALCAALALLTRIEWAIVGIPAALIGVARAAAPARLESLSARVLAASKQALYRVVEARGSLIIVLGAMVLLSHVKPRESTARAIFRALDPLDLSVLTYPAVLFDWLSVGAVFLCLLGWWHAVRSPLRHGLLPLTLAMLYKTYFASCHSGTANFEMLRYQALFNPATVFLALLGWRALAEWSHEKLPHGRERWLLALVLLSLTVRWPAPLGFAARRASVLAKASQPANVSGWLARNYQREVHFLVEARRAHPDCNIVVPTAARDRFDRGGHGITHFVPGELLVSQPDGLRSYEATSLSDLRRARPEMFADECVLYYHGLDCNIVDYDGCEEDVDAMELLERSRFLSLAYGEPEEWGPYEGWLELALYRLPANGAS
ncbi:MAG: hypothetical protein GXP55_03385 [Deltaproteobacteria bacterium]|nr:hypothetical protein [Deltaproteobacteria bacterium]